MKTTRRLLAAEGWDARSWEVPREAVRSAEWIDAFLQSANPTDHDSATARFLDGGNAELYVDAQGMTRWVVNAEAPPACTAQLLARLHRVMHAALETTRVTAASLYRSDWSAVPGLPDLELVHANTYAVVRNRGDLERDLGSVQPLREAGFDVRDTKDGCVLAERALGCADAVAYFEAVRDGQWHLARAAREGVVWHRSYGPPPAQLLAAWKAGAPRLQQVGYVPAQRALEYATFLEPDEHIRGWEIDELRWLLQAGELPDGDPLEEVRVVFADRAMAEREQRPLLDSGIRVLYRDGAAQRELSDRAR